MLCSFLQGQTECSFVETNVQGVFHLFEPFRSTSGWFSEPKQEVNESGTCLDIIHSSANII